MEVDLGMGMEGMGMQPKKKVAQDHIDTLRSALQQLSQAFVPAPGGPTTILHAHGPVDVEKMRREVDKSVGELCRILESYKALSAARQEKLLPRYLSLLRDRAQLSGQVEQFKKSLSHALRLAENHLALRNSTLTGEGEGSRQQLFVRNLQSVADAHGLQLYAFDPSEMGMDVAAKTLSASISGQHFLVDVHVTLHGHVDKANVTFTSAAGDPAGAGEGGEQGQFSRGEVDEEITRVLRAGDMRRFDRVVGLLRQLDTIYGDHPSVDLKQALWVLEEDLLELHRRERGDSAAPVEDAVLLRERHGIPVWRPEGLFVHYYSSPRHFLRDQLAGKRLEHTHGALVTLREGRICVKLPATSQLSALLAQGPGDLLLLAAEAPLAGGEGGSRIHFDLELEPPVPILSATLRRMLSLVWGPLGPHHSAATSTTTTTTATTADAFRPSPATDQLPRASASSSLQKLLCPPAAGTRFEQHGASYVYSGPEEAGTALHHVPFTHLRQLLPLLQHLRQQLVFNELFTSCFPGHARAAALQASGDLKPSPATHVQPDAVPQGDDAMDYTFDGGEMPLVEVAGVGPYALSVTLLDPATHNLICLQVEVLLGGAIRAFLHSSLLDQQPFSNDYVEELLRRSFSIPLTVKHLLLGKYGLAKRLQGAAGYEVDHNNQTSST